MRIFVAVAVGVIFTFIVIHDQNDLTLTEELTTKVGQLKGMFLFVYLPFHAQSQLEDKEGVE